MNIWLGVYVSRWRNSLEKGHETLIHAEPASSGFRRAYCAAAFTVNVGRHTH